MNKNDIVKSLVKFSASCNTSVRNVSGWNKDWKPAPQVPKNAAEIAAAAKKYGLLPADYKPDPQIGGDYPDVPLVGTHERSGYEQWDDRYWRRNWGEPIHKDFNMYVGERMDTSRLRVSVWKQCAAFFGFVGFFIGLLTLDLKYGPTPKLVAPQRPTPGVVHYTFERKDE